MGFACCNKSKRREAKFYEFDEIHGTGMFCFDLGIFEVIKLRLCYLDIKFPVTKIWVEPVKFEISSCACKLIKNVKNSELSE